MRRSGETCIRGLPVTGHLEPSPSPPLTRRGPPPSPHAGGGVAGKTRAGGGGAAGGPLPPPQGGGGCGGQAPGGGGARREGSERVAADVAQLGEGELAILVIVGGGEAGAAVGEELVLGDAAVAGCVERLEGGLG